MININPVALSLVGILSYSRATNIENLKKVNFLLIFFYIFPLFYVPPTLLFCYFDCGMLLCLSITCVHEDSNNSLNT